MGWHRKTVSFRSWSISISFCAVGCCRSASQLTMYGLLLHDVCWPQTILELKIVTATERKKIHRNERLSITIVAGTYVFRLCVCVCCYLCAVLYHGTLFFFSSARSEPRQHRINPMDNPFFFWSEIQQDHNEHLLVLLVSHSKWLLFAFLCMAAPQSRRWANFLFVLYCRF